MHLCTKCIVNAYCVPSLLQSPRHSLRIQKKTHKRNELVNCDIITGGFMSINWWGYTKIPSPHLWLKCKHQVSGNLNILLEVKQLMSEWVLKSPGHLSASPLCFLLNYFVMNLSNENWKEYISPSTFWGVFQNRIPMPSIFYNPSKPMKEPKVIGSQFLVLGSSIYFHKSWFSFFVCL